MLCVGRSWIYDNECDVHRGHLCENTEVFVDDDCMLLDYHRIIFFCVLLWHALARTANNAADSMFYFQGCECRFRKLECLSRSPSDSYVQNVSVVVVNFLVHHNVIVAKPERDRTADQQNSRMTSSLL